VRTMTAMRYVAVLSAVMLATGCAAQQRVTDERIEHLRLRLAKLEKARRTGPTAPNPTDGAAKITDLEREVSVLRTALRRVIDGAPDYSDTLAKVAARHSLLVTGLSFQEAVTARWWCGSFICFRSESLCKASEERGLKPGDKAHDCIPRRNVFCRGFGYPLLGGRVTGQSVAAKTMTCHAFLDACERLAADAGGDCLGIE
jgi:hypothetical protein